MRVTFQVGKGLNEYLQELGNLDYTAHETIGKAIYEGAGIVADAIRANIDSIPVDNDNDFKEKRSGLKTIQIKGLKEGFGIAPLKDENGYQHVKVGFHGYNSLKTKKFPMGQPNVMVARSIESGVSYMTKHPFVTPATNASKALAEDAMRRVIDDEISKQVK